MSTLNELKKNILSVIAKLKANLVAKGVSVDDTDTMSTLADKVNEIEGTSNNPNLYTVDLSIYGYSDEELADAKKTLDYNLVGIWKTPEGQMILNTPVEYSFATIDEMVKNNGFTRPVLVPPIRIKNNPKTSIPRGNELYSAIYRGNLYYTDALTEDGRGRSFTSACENNMSIKEIPGGNWQEFAFNVSSMFNSCRSLTEADLTLPLCESAGGIFNACSNLKKAKLIIPKVTSSRQFFVNCGAMEECYIDMPMNDRFDYTLERCTLIKRLTVIFGERINNYNNCFSWIFPGNYTLLKNICMHASVTVLNLSNITQWGMGSEENRQSLIDTLITYSYDRVAAGFSAATISLHANVKALLTEDEITRITNKGYTIA